jgi:hypothetical protein
MICRRLNRSEIGWPVFSECRWSLARILMHHGRVRAAAASVLALWMSLHIGICAGLGVITLALGIVSPEQLLLLGVGAGAASQHECRRGGEHEHDAEHDESHSRSKFHSCRAELRHLAIRLVQSSSLPACRGRANAAREISGGHSPRP